MGNKNPNTSEIVRLKKQESELKKQSVLSVLKELTLLETTSFLRAKQKRKKRHVTKNMPRNDS